MTVVAMHLFPEPETPAKIDGPRSGNAKLKARPRLSEAELRARGTLEFVINR